MRFLFLYKSVLSSCEVNFGEDFVHQVTRITSRCQACFKVFNVFLKHYFRRICPKELINIKENILKKEDKGTRTVVMNRENKINEPEGQKQLDDRNNYQPLDKPMVRDTSQRVKHLINALDQAGCIDEMTVKWFNLTPNPPRIPVFNTLTKIHKH